jgi:hypothetical protein
MSASESLIRDSYRSSPMGVVYQDGPGTGRSTTRSW